MKKNPVRFYTWTHNIENCLRNGSYVRQLSDGQLFQYMNGDWMGTIDAVPETMVEVSAKLAKKLLPKCCGGAA